MSGTVPPIPLLFGASSGNPGSPNVNRVDMMPTTSEPIKTMTTTNVAQNVADENLPQLLIPRRELFTNVSLALTRRIYKLEKQVLWSSNEFLANLNAEYHERALLANQKRFYKRSGRVRSARIGVSMVRIDADSSKNHTTSAIVVFKKIDDLTKGKSKKGKIEKGNPNKGLIAESFDWDDESVSSEDERITKIRAFMAIIDDEPSVGKVDARSG
ncbi:hypothetical protein Tco_0614952 [Tanacetum coccineum]